MKINPVTTVSPVRPSIVDGTSDLHSAKGKGAQPVAQAAVTAPVTSPSPLSEETKKNLTFATQEIAAEDAHTHKTPPAQQARAALAANPELAALPFGQIVSALARGEPLSIVAPPSSETDEEPVTDPIAEEPAPQPVTEPVEEVPSPTVVDLIVELPAPEPTIDPVIDELLNPLSAPEED